MKGGPPVILFRVTDHSPRTRRCVSHWMTSRAVGGAKSPCRKCRPLFLAYAPNASHASNTSTTSPISQSRLVTPAAIAGVVRSVFMDANEIVVEMLGLWSDPFYGLRRAEDPAFRPTTRPP